MRNKSLLAGAIAIVGVLAVGLPVVGAAASTAATSSGATKITCAFKIYNQTPTKLSGFSFAYINCQKPFGNGVQSATYSATLNTETGAATNKGADKNWFDAGTTYGTFSLADSTPALQRRHSRARLQLPEERVRSGQRRARGR